LAGSFLSAYDDATSPAPATVVTGSGAAIRAMPAFLIVERGDLGFVTVSTRRATFPALMLLDTSALSLTSREADSVDVATTFFACNVLAVSGFA